jgi:monofunctional glycosyltransferase
MRKGKINHSGVSIKAVFRSIYSTFTNDWKITQGGSTITQQLSRNVFLNFDKNYKRKVEEMFIAVKLEYFATKKFSVREDERI